MALLERTIYPRFPTTWSAKDLLPYTPTQAEIDFTYRSVRGSSTMLNFLAMLKTFQQLNFFPHPIEMPLPVLHHIHACLKFEDIAFTAYPERSLYRHQKTIRDYLGYKSEGKAARHLINRAAFETAQTRDDPADLINVAVEALVSANYELPAFSTLDRIVRRVRNLVNSGYYSRVLGKISQSEQEQLAALLEVTLPKRTSPFNQLKESAKSASLTNFKDLLAHLEWLESLGKVEEWLKELPLTKLKYFAAQAKGLDASDLGDTSPAKRYTLLVCLIHEARVTTRDNLTEMFIRRMGVMHKKGQQELELLRERQRGLNETLIAMLTEVLELAENSESANALKQRVISESKAEEAGVSSPAESKVEEAGAKATEPTTNLNDAKLGQAVRELLTESGGTDALLEACQSIAAYNDNNYLPLLPKFYRSQRQALFRLVRALKIHSATQNEALQKALNLILERQSSGAKWLPDELDLDFASEAWQKVVRVRKPRRRKYRLNRRLLEICVFSYLGFELRTGDMYVEGSEDYADYRANLLSWQECQPLLASYCEATGLENNAKSFVTEMRKWLTDAAKTVDEAFPQNEAVRINEAGEPVLKKITRREHSPTYAKLLANLHLRLKPRNLLQILANTEFWCSPTRHFGPLSGSEPKLEAAVEKYLLTVFAYGSGLGPVQTAVHLDKEVSEHQLQFVNRAHITTIKLEAANTEIINAYHRFSLPRMWGDEKVAVADGTKIELPENSLFSQHHFRYGGKGGIAYHHISDTYVALFTHFITCSVWEAVYIIDGLLKNKSLFQPDILHADTQGQSTPVFGLSYLLGIKLMPRIRNWHDLVFYRPDKNVRYQHIDSLFRETVDWQLLETHWQDLMRVVLSIKAGKILPSTLLRKLGSYSRKNKLYQAFAELGRVIRTIYLLEYITNLELRQEIGGSTNKVESYNRFCDWLTFGGEALLSVFDGEEREKRLKYTDLVANATMLQNVVDLTQLLRELKAEGLVFTKEDVAALSPYITKHIRRFGSYSLDLENKPDPLNDDNLSIEL